MENYTQILLHTQARQFELTRDAQMHHTALQAVRGDRKRQPIWQRYRLRLPSFRPGRSEESPCATC